MGWSIGILVLVVLLFGGTYAWLTYTANSSKNNTLKAGEVSLKLTEVNSINLEEALPMSDENGKITTPYTFSLENTGNHPMQYQIILENDDTSCTGCNWLPDQNIKYALTKDEHEENPQLLSELKDRILDSGVINKKSSSDYHLRLWIDANTTNEAMGKEFYGKLKVVAVQTEEDQYVKEGLVLFLDGKNSGNQKNKWKDLSGNGNDATMTDFAHNDTSGWLKEGGLKFANSSNQMTSVNPLSYQTELEQAYTVTMVI